MVCLSTKCPVSPAFSLSILCLCLIFLLTSPCCPDLAAAADSEDSAFCVDPTDPLVGRTLVEEAVREFNAGRFQNSCKALSMAVLYRDTALRRLLLARAAENWGDYELAVQSLKRAREIEPLPHIVSEIRRVKTFVAEQAEQEQQEAEEALRKRLLAERLEGGLSNFNAIREEILDLTKGTTVSLEAQDNDLPPLTPEEESAIQTLLQGLTSPSNIVKSRSVDGLVATGRPDMSPHIALLLDDPDHLLRMDTAIALGRLASPLTTVRLLERLFIETDEDVVEQLISALGKVDSAAVATGLKKYRQGIPRAGKAYRQVDRVLDSLNR